MVSAAVASVLGQDGAHFDLLVEKLMSPSNEERGQAETIFNECKQHPEQLVTKLVQTLRANGKSELRAMSAVLLRKVITKDEVSLWRQMSPNVQSALKAELLQCVQHEQDKTISKKLCSVVAELAVGLLDEGNWPELLPFMFQCVSSDSDRLKTSALLIFADLAEYNCSMTQHLSTLHGLFQQCLSAATNGEVRIAALRATTNFVQTLETAEERDKFQDLLPAMMQTLNLALNAREELAAQEALEMFIEVAGSEPRFLRRHLAEVVAAMLQIAEAAELDEATRHLAVEFLVTLAEARERAPGMMRKLPHFIVRLFSALMSMLLDVDDVPEWYTVESEDDDVAESDNHSVAQECLDRLTISLGGNTVLPVASQLLPAFIRDADWKKRHAALITLAQIAEGCNKAMVKQLGAVVEMVLCSFNDPHPRVRWAAINAIGQLSTDLGPDLQQNHHAQVLPALLTAMDDFQNQRVQAHAAAAIVNFSEGCKADVLTPYLDGVIGKLIVLLEKGTRMVQEGALTALASVADCSQSQFEKYYDMTIPYLKAVLLNANDKSNRMLRAKAMECISLVGMAVGKEKFRNDAKQVMDVLMRLQGSEMEDDDPTINYMLQAWARLCKCLGQEFLPYMNVVMPPLMKSAQLKPDVTITDADSDEDEEEEDDDDSVEMIRLGDKKIGIRTSVLEEKATACNMICCYADELKEGFFPWIEQVAPILVPLLKFYFHEEVRKAAVSAIPELLRSAKLAVEKGVSGGRDTSYVKQLADYALNPLVEALQKEPETEIVSSILEALNESMQIVGTLLEEAQVKAMVEQFQVVLKASEQRKTERQERKKIEDFDEEEKEFLEEENEQEAEVFEQVGECIGTLLKTFKADFLPYLDELMALIVPMLAPGRSSEEKRVVICIFDDAIEYAGEAAAVKYFEVFLPAVLMACTDDNADVRQAAVYGIGVCAQFTGMRFRPIALEALGRLRTVVVHPEAKLPENAPATDNAVSAIGKICQYQRDCIDASQVLPLWLNCLPLKNDLLEARMMHELLCNLVESSDPALLGHGSENLGKVVAVFAEVIAGGADLATEQTSSRMMTTLRTLRSSITPETLVLPWVRELENASKFISL
ncbi:hypothetical protein CBR_g74670 [Chara braunii]|uniref:TOG domain-containing protein n=1 Tax=Chara braunii TaxID=69332 RepID=A0A388KA83_CHABU|nr:hypothetical protein CBR_g74670 [Chara braunii]|eukprot:GBG66984.1 hypothetical protein CBR_g74670 [Chara braunii]